MDISLVLTLGMMMIWLAIAVLILRRDSLSRLNIWDKLTLGFALVGIGLSIWSLAMYEPPLEVSRMSYTK